MTAISVLVTSYHEPDTLPRALGALHLQLPPDSEVLVICPDNETAQAAARFEAVQVVRDPGIGKPAAINLGLAQTGGEIAVLTDGDVYVGPNVLSLLLSPFADAQVGAVSARPVSISPRNTMLGYWSHLLTDAGAHAERLKRDATGQFFVCSGYLFAIRRRLIDAIPEDALAEDAVISHRIGEQGYRIRYAPDAHVYVKYPDNYRDWLKQKVRSAGGYAQPYIADSPLQMRSFRHEALAGTGRALSYPRTPHEFLWTLILFAARLHLWTLIFWRVRVRRIPLNQLWQRVESTK
jgi:cellulose synthase/poly-beta-1,6-N-acetylglucosamine synthase-like glycosyltransferase